MKKIIAFLLFSSSLFAQGWQWQYPKPQGNTLWDLHVINGNTAVSVGELGTIIKTTTGGDTHIDNSHHSSAMPQKVFLYHNYPNNPSTTIRYVISKPGFISLKIYDLLGREVETLVKEYQSAGKY